MSVFASNLTQSISKAKEQNNDLIIQEEEDSENSNSNDEEDDEEEMCIDNGKDELNLMENKKLKEILK